MDTMEHAGTLRNPAAEAGAGGPAPSGCWVYEAAADLEPGSVRRALAELTRLAEDGVALRAGQPAGTSWQALRSASGVTSGPPGRMRRPIRVVALESSPRATQELAAACASGPLGRWPGRSGVQTYRDCSWYHDPRDPHLRYRGSELQLERLAQHLEQTEAELLLLAPQPEELPRVAVLVSQLGPRFPELKIGLLGSLAGRDPLGLAARLPEFHFLLRGLDAQRLAEVAHLSLVTAPALASPMTLLGLAAAGGGLLLRGERSMASLELGRWIQPADPLHWLPPADEVDPAEGWLDLRLPLEPRGDVAAGSEVAAWPGELDGATLARWLLQAAQLETRQSSGTAGPARYLRLWAPRLAADAAGLAALAEARRALPPDRAFELHLAGVRLPVAVRHRAPVIPARRAAGRRPHHDRRPGLRVRRSALLAVGPLRVRPAGARVGASVGLVAGLGVRLAQAGIRSLTWDGEVLALERQTIEQQLTAAGIASRPELPLAPPGGRSAHGHSIGAPGRPELTDLIRESASGPRPVSRTDLLGRVFQELAARVATIGLSGEPGESELAEAWSRLAQGEVEAALRLVLQACRLVDAQGGLPHFELLRLWLELGGEPAALQCCEALPGLNLDPGWVGLQSAYLAQSQGRPVAACRLLLQLLAYRPDWPLLGPDRPATRELDLLHGLAVAARDAGESALAEQVARRLLAHPGGRLPAVAPAPRPEPLAVRTRPAADRTWTLISLQRDDETRRRVVPAGCLSLIAALREQGWDGVLLDWQLTSESQFLDPDALVRAVGEPGPVIGLSAMADRLPLLVRAVARLRQAFPDRLLVAGGPGPSAVPGPLLRVATGLDVVVCGEGERTLQELLARWTTGGREALAGCPGTVVRQGEALVAGPPRPRIRELDWLPLPAYDALLPGQYDDFTILTSRGCPHHCSFCDATARWGALRVTRRIAAVVDELELLVTRHGARHLHLEDDTFLQPRSRVLEFCAELRQRLPGVSWSCLGRADGLDDALLEQLVASGCRSLFLGLETGSERGLQLIGKGLRLADGLAGALRAQRHLPVRAYYIWGFPWEGLAEFHATFASLGLLRARGVDVCYSLLAPFPGTPLLADRRWSELQLRHDLPFPRLFHPSGQPEEQALIENYPELFPFFRILPTPDWEAKREFVDRYWQSHLRRLFTLPP